MMDQIFGVADEVELRDLRMLVALATGDHHSLRDVQRITGIPMSTARSRLRRLREVFERQLQVNLFDDQYQLTENGRHLADNANRVLAAFLDVVEGLDSPAVALRIPCTSDCLRYFSELRDALPPDRKFDIRPHAIRTGELRDHGTPSLIALGSVLMHDGQSMIDGHTEVIEITSDVIALISYEDLDLPTVVSLKEILAAGVVLLTPDGGPANDLLQHIYPHWERVYSAQHLPIPHLNYGLSALAEGLPVRGGMLVHKRLALSHSSPGRRLYQWDLQQTAETSHRAVTGVLFDRRGEKIPEHFEVIWEAARDRWQPAGSLFDGVA